MFVALQKELPGKDPTKNDLIATLILELQDESYDLAKIKLPLTEEQLPKSIGIIQKIRENYLLVFANKYERKEYLESELYRQLARDSQVKDQARKHHQVVDFISKLQAVTYDTTRLDPPLNWALLSEKSGELIEKLENYYLRDSEYRQKQEGNRLPNEKVIIEDAVDLFEARDKARIALMQHIQGGELDEKVLTRIGINLTKAQKSELATLRDARLNLDASQKMIEEMSKFGGKS